MKNIFIGFMIGILFSASIAWAAASFVWVDNNGKAMGTSTNPVYIR